MNETPGAGPAPGAEDPLDAYSRTVIRVAESVTPHVAAFVMARHGRNELAGTIGRIVIDDEHMDITRQRPQLLHQDLNIFCFVVGRHN